ncbi:class I SAM-dependent methyltransferase [Pseudoalteromonas sp. DY56-GL79]|uniref:class I SAM-dependent methyltransferase n=1 Tax=Pseudoalteromonas sp. DY56-GL79 TaxID=2967131 RepID=UPI00352AA93B
MRNSESWTPSKFVYKNGELRANKDLQQVSLSSRLAVELVAMQYNRYLGDFVTGSLLDLGCGKVPFYQAYSSNVSQTTCVDWGESLHQSSYVDELCDLNQPLPFATETFDTVLSSDVLEHLLEPQMTIREVARVLTPNGTFIFNTPFMYWLHEQPHDYYRYTRFAIERMASEAGLEVVVLNEVGGALEVAADVLSKFFNKLPILGKPVCWLIQSAAIALARTRLGQKIMQRTQSVMPMGYFTVLRKK